MRLRVIVLLLACVHILRSECMCHHVPHLKYWSKKHNRALVCLFTSVHFSQHLSIYLYLVDIWVYMRLRVIVCLFTCVHNPRSECTYHHHGISPNIIQYHLIMRLWTIVCLFTFVHFSRHLIYIPSSIHYLGISPYHHQFRRISGARM